LDEEEVVEAAGLEVRDAPPVDMDARRLGEPFDGDRLFDRGPAAFSGSRRRPRPNSATSAVRVTRATAWKARSKRPVSATSAAKAAGPTT
jgi:hypothetical protein